MTLRESHILVLRKSIILPTLDFCNARIGYRQMEVTHSMENVIYNELRIRGYKVDVGNLNITEQDKNKKFVKSNLRSTLSAQAVLKILYSIGVSFGNAGKTAQEIRPFLKINDSFKKVVITSNTPKPFYTEDGILMMSILIS